MSPFARNPFPMALSTQLALIGLLVLAVSRKTFIFVGVIGVIAFLMTATRRARRACKNCGEVNREEAVYCAQCGARLPGR
jgi:hypothetical protein